MISIIVSLYNDQKYIAHCLDSILKQEWKNRPPSDIEVIVVNDGSLDGSAQIVEHYATRDDRIRLVTQPNGGLSRARNTGIKSASGEFLLFVDADDELPSNALQKLLDAIEEDDADAAVGSIGVKYEVHHEMRESDTLYYTVRYQGTHTVDDALIDDFHCSACAVLFRKSIIERNALCFPDGLLYEDACWHWKYFSCSRKIAFVQEPVYIYWRHAKSIMSSTFEQQQGVAIQHLHVAEKIFEFWKERGELDYHKRTALKLLDAFFWFAFQYSQNFEKPRAAYECARIIKRFDLDVTHWENLRKISQGELSFLFPPKHEAKYESDMRNYARYIQIRTIANQFMPPGSRRRRCAYIIARIVWRIYSRLAGRRAV